RLLLLERPPEPPACTPEVGHLEDVLAEGRDRSGRGPDEPAHDVEEGRLARAVRADQPAGAAGEDDRHVVDRHDSSEADGEPVDLGHPAGSRAGTSRRARPKSKRPRFRMSFGNCSARPRGAVVSTCSTPMPKRMVANSCDSPMS